MDSFLGIYTESISSLPVAVGFYSDLPIIDLSLIIIVYYAHTVRKYAEKLDSKT